MPSESPQAGRPQRALALAIRELRQRQKMTQEQVALAAGSHPAEISSLESGRRNPTYAALLRISHGLGVAPSELLALAEVLEKDAVRSQRD